MYHSRKRDIFPLVFVSRDTRSDQTCKTPEDLSTREREERGRGEGVGLYDVYIRERGGGGRGECGLKSAISVVIHT